MCLTAVSYVLPVELAGIDSHFHVPVFFLLLLQLHVTVYGFLDIEALLLGYDEISEELLHSARAIIEADNEMQRIKDKIGMFYEI